MASSPNAIAGSQAADESQDPLETVEPIEEPTETETPVEPGDGEPETPAEPEAGDGTAPPESGIDPDAAVPTEPQIKKSDVQKRIDALTRRRYQLETQNTQLQTELEALRNQPQAQPSQAQPAQVPINLDPSQLGLPPRPVKEQFETNDAYLESVAMWQAVYEVRRQTVVQNQIAAQNKQIATQNTVIENWNSAVEKARQVHEDFDDVVGTDQKIPQAAFTAIVDSPAGTEIAYYLGQHPEEIQRLNKLATPVAVVREIGKLEAKLAQPAAVSPKPGAVTPAPKPAAKPPAAVPVTQQNRKPSTPITPVGTSRPVSAGGTSSGKDPSTMSYREYKKWREDNGTKR